MLTTQKQNKTGSIRNGNCTGESQAIIIPTKENIQIFHPEENKDQTTLGLRYQKSKSSRKTYISALLIMPKPLCGSQQTKF